MNREGLVRALKGIERGRGKRYPAELRAGVLSFSLTERSRGRSWSEIADDLGLGVPTLMRWCSGQRALPVVVKHAETSTLSVVTPSGWRIEGVTLSQVAELLGGR